MSDDTESTTQLNRRSNTMSNDADNKTTTLQEARRALKAIYLEVPAAVGDDLNRRVEAAFESLGAPKP